MGAVYGGRLNRSARFLTHVVTTDGLDESQPEYDTVAGNPGVVAVCQKCGEVWCKITNFYLCPETNEPKQSEFRAVSSPCSEHGGGSILPVWPTTSHPHLQFNPQALVREIDLLLKTEEPKEG